MAEKVQVDSFTDSPRACVVSKGTDVILLRDFSTWDLSVVQVNYRKANGDGEGILYLAFAYFAHERELRPEEVKRLVKHCRENNIDLVIGCDANEHWEAWSSKDSSDKEQKPVEKPYSLSGNARGPWA